MARPNKQRNPAVVAAELVATQANQAVADASRALDSASPGDVETARAVYTAACEAHGAAILAWRQAQGL